MTRTTSDEIQSTVVAFRASQALISALDEAAAQEGLTRADIARRATLQALRRKDGGHE